MFNNLIFTSRFVKSYNKSFNLILQYNLEAQQLIKRERTLAGHYTINMGLEGNSVVFPQVLIFCKMLIMGPEIHQEWGYKKSLPRTVTTNRTRQVTFLHTQETKILCAYLTIL